MKEYCIDLEIAKELKENGFPQETEFYWNLYKAPGSAFPLDDNLNKILESYKAKIGMNEACYATYSAFISDEILKELQKKLFGCHLQIDRTDIAYYVWYVPIGTDIDQRPKDFVAGNMDEKLVNAFARKWLYLKKEGLLNEISKK